MKQKKSANYFVSFYIYTSFENNKKRRRNIPSALDFWRFSLIRDAVSALRARLATYRLQESLPSYNNLVASALRHEPH